MCAYGWRHSSFYTRRRTHTTSLWIRNKRMSHLCWGRRDQESFVYREVRKDFGKRFPPADGKWWPNNWNERPHFGPFHVGFLDILICILIWMYLPVVAWKWCGCGAACDGRTIRREARTSTDTANLFSESRKIRNSGYYRDWISCRKLCPPKFTERWTIRFGNFGGVKAIRALFKLSCIVAVKCTHIPPWK
jgi:hypothetical protein